MLTDQLSIDLTKLEDFAKNSEGAVLDAGARSLILAVIQGCRDLQVPRSPLDNVVAWDRTVHDIMAVGPVRIGGH